jgi:hypothetical protein
MSITQVHLERLSQENAALKARISDLTVALASLQERISRLEGYIEGTAAGPEWLRPGISADTSLDRVPQSERID